MYLKRLFLQLLLTKTFKEYLLELALYRMIQTGLFLR